MKYVDIAIHLFGEPELELQDYEPTANGIRQYAADKGRWLDLVADIAGKLQRDGWSLKVVDSSLEARHPEVHTHAEAVERLEGLHIDMEAITDIAEWSDGERLTAV